MSTDRINPLTKIGDIHYALIGNPNKYNAKLKILEFIVTKIGRKYAYYQEEPLLRYDFTDRVIQCKEYNDWPVYAVYIYSNLLAAEETLVRFDLAQTIMSYCRNYHREPFESVSFATLQQFVLELTNNSKPN